MIWMEMIIYVAAEVGGAMKPRADANENTARKPLRPIVTVRSTGIRRHVIVTVRTHRGWPDLDGHLSLRSPSRRAQQQQPSQGI